jgi:hypothetical protein
MSKWAPASRMLRFMGTRAPMKLLHAVNQRWSLDFVSDRTTTGMLVITQ